MRHSHPGSESGAGSGGNPECRNDRKAGKKRRRWIPAFAGMTTACGDDDCVRECAFAAGVLFLVSGEVAMAGDKHLGTEGRVRSADGRYEKQGLGKAPLKRPHLSLTSE